MSKTEWKRWCEWSVSLGLKLSLNPVLSIYKSISTWEFRLKFMSKIIPHILKGWKYDWGITH